MAAGKESEVMRPTTPAKARVRRRIAAVIVVLAAMSPSLLSVSGCSMLRREKPAQQPASTPAAPQGAPQLRATRGLPGEQGIPGAATGTEKLVEETPEQKQQRIMRETGFDMTSPNFNRKIGRKNPFAPASLSAAPFEFLKRSAPESYRLLAVADGLTGRFAMLEMDKAAVIVRVGDMVKGTQAKVRRISDNEVVLEQEGNQIKIGMKVRERKGKEKEDQKEIGKLPTMADWYQSYLDQKYEEDEGGAEGEEEKGSKSNYHDFLSRHGKISSGNSGKEKTQ